MTVNLERMLYLVIMLRQIEYLLCLGKKNENIEENFIAKIDCFISFIAIVTFYFSSKLSDLILKMIRNMEHLT